MSSKVIVAQTARRRARKSATANLKDVPSLAEFVHRRTVLHQYRSFLKCIHSIPKEDEKQRNHMRVEVKERFLTLQHETDSLTIQMAIKEGDRRLAQLQSMVGYTPTSA
eukprot:CAMPEP_0119021916 /NCGR_PEP_ID=MMETSP1176-20130426/26984_1 /TAXON_ID=265551 /ORGANISM="Synedropsis recta cf, Strain CCMP1620" /LENGTH=108 /DNA_ID=CAMNT_0006976633 /DNA_START=109 /DNA_END=431 /DNA_ORIENTATION=+